MSFAHTNNIADIELSNNPNYLSTGVLFILSYTSQERQSGVIYKPYINQISSLNNELLRAIDLI